jgi:hypothetical protein
MIHETWTKIIQLSNFDIGQMPDASRHPVSYTEFLDSADQ